MINGIDNVSIVVKDLKSVVEWYKGVLGLGTSLLRRAFNGLRWTQVDGVR